VIPTSALRAVRSRDERFDGIFFYGVSTTGIFCRPSCPATPAKVEHLRLFPSAAAALAAGFRCCKRCRPGAAPGTPEWRIRNDIARRAVQLIADGAVDEVGVGALADSLGYSDRQVRRHLIAEIGAPPSVLARSRRAEAARLLLESTTHSNAEIAFASGFRSLRQFHETLRAVYDRTPTELRMASSVAAHDGVVTIELPFRKPLDVTALFDALEADASRGFATFDGSTYRRALRLSGGIARCAVRYEQRGVLACDLVLGDLRDLPVAVSRIRRFLDLDADPLAIAEALGEHERLAPFVDARPGLRLLGSTDPLETVCDLVATAPELDGPPSAIGTIRSAVTDPEVDGAAVFPALDALGTLDLAAVGWSAERRALLAELLDAIGRGDINLTAGSDSRAVLSAFQALGVPRSVVVGVRRRILSDPDVLVSNDPTLHAASGVWSPWRSYAEAYLSRAVAPAQRATQGGSR
jgi:AraC family transcriptional regulator of adaptative response / DNA-3-methyladenine glycosylase II